MFPVSLYAQQVTATVVPIMFEKVYLHTDRDMYMQGDTIWFKSYSVNPQDGRPGTISRNLYVDLVFLESKIARSVVIRLDKGLGHGDIDLGDDIPPGIYRLRAYTNWMRNFGDNFIFEKIINVAGKNSPATPVAVKPAVKAPAKTPVIAAPAVPGISSLLSFYPEGGSLVEGVLSRVAVKARKASGGGIMSPGAVLSSVGDTVATFTTDSLGFGLFALLPVKGISYRAVLQGAAAAGFPLPDALSTGPALLIRQTDSLVRVVIGSGDTVERAYTLMVKHAGKAMFGRSFMFSAQISVSIPTYLMSDGVSAITLYDQSYRPVCERLVYIDHPDVNPVHIITDKKSYHPGEKVTVNLSAVPGTNLSMAVVDANTVPKQPGDIVSYLRLESELRGKIEQVDRYFDTTNVNRFKQLDLLLMTQGWRDFVWRRMADTTIGISYEPEDGVSIAGKVKIEDGKPLPGMNVSLYATAAKGIKLFSATTDSAGRFYFPGVEYYGSQPVKLSARNERGVNKGTFYLDTLVPLPAGKSPRALVEKGLDSVGLEEFARGTAQGQARLPQPKDHVALGEVKVSTSRQVSLRSGFFTPWGPDQVFNISPADKELKTLEWYLLQRANGATRYNNGVVFPGSGILAYPCPNLSANGSTCYRLQSQLLPPVLFVNGREVYTDENEVAEAYRSMYYAMPITKFKQIVLRKVAGRSRDAPAGASHLIIDRYILYLTLTEEAMFGDNSGVLNTMLDGYYEARNFYEPLTSEQALKSAYRTTLYWKPDIHIAGNGEGAATFFTTAQEANLRVIVQGLTPEGRPVAGLASYQVQ